MYIKFFYELLNESKDIKTYKEDLKNYTKLNLRRVSKYNILGVLGALKCLEGREIDTSELAIYMTSEFSCAINVAQCVTKANSDEPHSIMPFDFLNVNSHIAGFYIAKAVEAKGKNMVLASQDISFAKALHLAKFELSHNIVSSALIGGVDTSMDELSNSSEYFDGMQTQTKDCSCWIYCDNDSKGAVAKVSEVLEFSKTKEVVEYLNSHKGIKVNLNRFAAADEVLQKQIQNERVDSHKGFCGSQIAVEIVWAIGSQLPMIFVCKARNGSFILLNLL